MSYFQLWSFLKTSPGSKTAIDRWGAMKWLQKQGINVAPFGYLHSLYDEYGGDRYCIVWKSDGNEKMKIKEAFRANNNATAALYVGQDGRVSACTKYVQIGPNVYYVDIFGYTDWRATHGDFQSEIVKVRKGHYSEKIPLPFFSIDYVRKDNEVYAIDIDVTPCLGKYGFEKVLTQSEAARLIRQGIEHFYGGSNVSVPVCQRADAEVVGGNEKDQPHAKDVDCSGRGANGVWPFS